MRRIPYQHDYFVHRFPQIETAKDTAWLGSALRGLLTDTHCNVEFLLVCEMYFIPGKNANKGIDLVLAFSKDVRLAWVAHHLYVAS